ncbi:TetR/AcrR family transcriptional regulator [Streptomyces sp. CT34]|uniref:TetR/AcrR family transcriptional regulator n=1 Tax=Streptomyces sp. CT34 TaxID=1553907 RepID=UPI0005BA3E96|nr:TetR/AcrR family transcriptional regulator [Streptomyces sp. CT34]
MTSSERRPVPGGPVWFDEPAPPRATEQLSRERIVNAAVELADDQVPAEITMRALAARLGVRSPMALYRYVGSKDGLVDLMTDRVYGQITVPRGHGWRRALQGLGRTGWDAVQRHPWFARLAFSRPPMGPNALRLYDTALAELAPFGLDATTRMGFVKTVLGHVLGSGLALLEEQTMRARVGFHSDSDLEAAAAPYIERIAAAGEHPHFISWATDPRRHAPEPQSFEQVLEWLLDGLATLLPPEGRPPA